MTRLLKWGLVSALVGVAFAAVGVSFGVGAALAPAEPLTDGQVKAAYVYKFAKFVEWPAEVFASANAPIRVAVIGYPEFADAFIPFVGGREAQGRPFEVRRVSEGDDLDGFHIAVFDLDRPGRVAELIEALGESPTLTIGDGRRTAAGVIIQLFRSRDSVKFALDVGAAEHARIQLSSRLIGVAARVTR